MDCLLSNRKKYGRKAIPENKVKNTWINILMDRNNLQNDWVREGGVLVDIAPEMQRLRIG